MWFLWQRLLWFMLNRSFCFRSSDLSTCTGPHITLVVFLPRTRSWRDTAMSRRKSLEPCRRVSMQSVPLLRARKARVEIQCRERKKKIFLFSVFLNGVVKRFLEGLEAALCRYIRKIRSKWCYGTSHSLNDALQCVLGGSFEQIQTGISRQLQLCDRNWWYLWPSTSRYPLRQMRCIHPGWKSVRTDVTSASLSWYSPDRHVMLSHRNL